MNSNEKWNLDWIGSYTDYIMIKIWLWLFLPYNFGLGFSFAWSQPWEEEEKERIGVVWNEWNDCDMKERMGALLGENKMK